jgi:hypothetical protein
MPRGKYVRTKRKDPKKLSLKEARALKKAASVVPAVDHQFDKAELAQAAERVFNAPSRPYRNIVTIIQNKNGHNSTNFDGTSELLEEVAARVRVGNPDAYRITVMEVTVSATASFVRDTDPL